MTEPIEVGELVLLRPRRTRVDGTEEDCEGCGCDDCNFDYDACDADVGEQAIEAPKTG